MILLTSTSDLIQLVTGQVCTVDVQASFVDLNAGVVTPARSNSAITIATTTSIIASPASSTQRSVKEIFIKNKNVSSFVDIIVKHTDGTTPVEMWKGTLLSGESIYFMDSVGWIYLSSFGTVKTLQSAAGADTQIQYNNNGAYAASPNFIYNPVTNTFSILGIDPVIKLQGITNEPGVQSTGILAIYSKLICGKMMLKQVGPSGLDTPLQNALWQNNTVLFTPGAAAGFWQGTVGTNLGVPVIALPTTTVVATMLRRSNFPTVVTTANQQVGTRTESMFFRGNGPNIGGFFMATRFMLASWTAGNRLFVGLCSGTTTVVTVDPSTLTNMLGFGVNAGDTAITFMHNDALGTCTKETIATQPTLATNNGYVAYIFCRPNDAIVYYRLDDLNAGVTLIDTSITTDLPVNTTALTCQAIIGNASNVVAGNANIGINRIYIETDI